jgi:hypothetical protein
MTVLASGGAAAFGAFYWIGLICVGLVYWFKYTSPRENFMWRRYKTGLVCVFWPAFLIWLLVKQQQPSTDVAARQDDEARKRILG